MCLFFTDWRMLIKARFFVAFGLLLQLLQTTTSTKAAPLQVTFQRLSYLFQTDFNKTTKLYIPSTLNTDYRVNH